MLLFTIIEVDQDQDRFNVGTVQYDDTIKKRFKKAIEGHFDGTLVSYTFPHPDVNQLQDCLNAVPIDVQVTMKDVAKEKMHMVEVSQTWLY